MRLDFGKKFWSHLNRAGLAELFVNAFCNSRKDSEKKISKVDLTLSQPGHGVCPMLWVLPDEIEHFDSVGRELAAQESVDEKYVGDYIYQEEEFTKEHSDCPVIVRVQGGVEKVGQS